MIVALAGRRVDPKERFPPRFSSTTGSVETVRQQIHDSLLSLQTSVLICSAACGSDLLALVEAGKLGIRRRVILPFNRHMFRAASVIDRPGNWGQLYDTVIDEVLANGDLVTAHNASSKHASYLAVNHMIVDEAISLSGVLEQTVIAIRIWEGHSRGRGDLTEEFGEYAQSMGIRVFDILTV